ncbi:MAG: AAA family ATPase [Cypionkella sp.]|uniref:AAA family ATPase n=1 Tax=Cypionkella sp. TaxID=2811411 RepID=UPI002AB9B991|nr:AAA family ATPase [Cypionkella sp.]MDZ4312073.1 AAA family ATPase [Cypionkella sp.]
MTALTQSRRIIFYDAEGVAYQPVRHGDRATGKSVFKIKPKGASNHADAAVHTEDILEVARAMLVDGLAARCKALAGGPVNYLRYGAEKLLRYEIGQEIAQALGIPNAGRVGEIAVTLSRQAVEEAIDAYERYRATGEHGDIFSAFGEPRDYWVRSTRLRSRPVYPTKPIVAFARAGREPQGGWSLPTSAAAQLHNSGFIIVDNDDRPVSPPDKYEHLIRDAHRIRLCALNYYIAPARERGDAQVVIRAGTLNNEMGLSDAWPNVCQALRGLKFQTLADVPPPDQAGPDQSTSTTFTYNLIQDGSASKVTQDTAFKQPSPTNTILYGPPGTGKTFATAYEAVRLCLGDAIAVPLRGDRAGLMMLYRKLVSEGRIEFVTFHQSFSYEDFVEGLRPTTDKAKDDTESEAPASAGFSLKPYAGVFKQISERARLDTGSIAESRLERNRNLFKLSLIGSDWRARLAKSLEDSKIFWGFGGKVDWSPEEYEQFEAIKARWRDDHPDANGRYADISGTWYFRAGVETGDYVVLTVGKNQIVAIGRVTGAYEFIAAEEEFPHARSVEWIWSDFEGADRSAFYPEQFSSFQPIYKLDETSIDWDGLESIVYNRDALPPTIGARDFVLVIDEINRANISKVFGELITLLEADKRLGCLNEVRLRLPYSATSFGVPSNLHIIGTMNTADRSIALLDTALRRRFTFQELMPDVSALRAALAARGLDAENLDGINLCRLLTTLNERIEYLFDRDHQIGHGFFTGCTDKAGVEDVMRHKVIPLLSEYFYDDWSKVAAVLGDRAGSGQTYFLEAKRLAPPDSLAADDMGEEKWRWSVRSDFDFAKFQAP